MARSILFVTGTRADYGKLAPLATVVRDAGFDVSFFVTGMHMMARYGLTKTEVHRMSGVRVHEFLNQRPDDPQDIVLAKTVIGFSDFVQEMHPDLVVIHGDRIEATASALVTATNYIRSAHIEGGEVSGTIDEVLRHCNTKLASHHFVSSDDAARRVQALGEPPEYIHVIGSPELDVHGMDSGVTLDEVKRRYEIAFDDYGICTFHSVTSEPDTMGQQAEAFFAALQDSRRQFVVIAPNNDPGSHCIFAVIDKLPKAQFRVIPSLRFNYFSELMKNAACIVGNSSAGVREAPFLGIASLDVGSRQTNRALSPTVTAVMASDRTGILDFMANRWGARFPRHCAYGQGLASTRFLEVLQRAEFWDSPLQKTFHEGPVPLRQEATSHQDRNPAAVC